MGSQRVGVGGPARFRARFGVLVTVLSILSVFATGCGSNAGGSGATTGNPGPRVASSGSSAHAIHVFAVRADGTKTRLDLGQGTEISAPSSGGGPGAVAMQNVPAPGLRFLNNGGADGGSIVTAPATIGSPATDIESTAWALVQRLAYQCESPLASTSVDTVDGLARGGLAAADLPPWELANNQIFPPSADWFVFHNLGQSCSGRLLQEQTLLCMADKFGEIGDAVGTVVLPSLGGCGGPFSEGSGDAPATDPNNPNCDFFVEWDVPPQADRDRFIARDLAIHTLGMLATLDATPVGGTSFNSFANPNAVPEATCSSIFSQVASGTLPMTNGSTNMQAGSGLNETGNSRLVFGLEDLLQSGLSNLPVYPPSNVPLVTVGFGPNGDPFIATDNSPAVALTALQTEAQILRAGGRLLHDLIRRDVYSDLAAAALQSGQAIDPAQGTLVEWGADPQTGPYGTLAHAARVLVGRWEIGDTPAAFNGHGDPQCEGVTALNVLQGAYGNDLTAREQDRPIRTKGESLAANLVSQAGIAMPTCAIAASSGATLREALVDQLVLQTQLQNGLSNPPGRSLFEAVAQSATDAEIIFGFEYALRSFRLLTDSADHPVPSSGPPGGGSCAPFALDPNGLTAGLLPATSAVAGVAPVAPSVTALLGIVVQGGLDRSRLSIGTIARAGGILEASQCRADEDDVESIPNLQTGVWGFPSVATADPADLSIGGISTPLPSLVFQDAFSIGQAFERQLVALNGITAPLVPTGAAEDPNQPEAISRGGIAELRSWAGGTLVTSWVEGPISPGPGAPPVPNLAITISGMDYSALGLSGPTDPNATATLQGAFGVVYGPPWKAECAAHMRKDCPPNFSTTQVQTPAFVAQTATATNPLVASGAASGLLGPTFSFTLPYQFPLASSSASTSHIYLVLLHDLTNPLGQGQILGVIAPVNPANVFVSKAPSSFVVAPMQQELLHSALDLGKWVGAAPPRLGDPSAADTSGYCVDGVPRDLFVPLQNELTSDSSGNSSFEDSWQHYLSIAQTAATTADTLAQQLLADDTEVAQTEQAANEQLAEQCGDFGAISETTISSNGAVQASPDDPTLQACLSEPTVDVVFLGASPAPAGACSTAAVAATADPTSFLTNTVLKCGSAGASDALCGIAKSRPLTCAALGLSVPQSPPTDCTTTAKNIATSLRTRFDAQGFRTLLNQPVVSDDGTQQLVSGLHFTEDLFDRWQVTYLGTPIMDSDPADNSTNPIDASTLWPACHLVNDCTSPQSQAFDALYRWCSGPLGSCATASTGAAAGTPDAQQAELNILKWRVMGSITLLAGAAGVMPDGLFSIPLPLVINNGVVNISTTNNDQAFLYSDDYRAAPAFYVGSLQGDSNPADVVSLPARTILNSTSGAGFTRPSASVTPFQIFPVTGPPQSTSAELLQLGTVYGISPAFTTWPSASLELPTYYWSSNTTALTVPSAILSSESSAGANNVDITYNSWYGANSISTMRHKVESNTAVSFPHCLALQQVTGSQPTGCAVPAAGNAPAAPPSNPLSMSLMFANSVGALDGVSCAVPFGAANNLNGGNDLGLADIVSATKTERYLVPSGTTCIGPCIPCFDASSDTKATFDPNIFGSNSACTCLRPFRIGLWSCRHLRSLF